MDVAESPILSRLKVSNRLPTPKGVALEVINLTQRDDVSNPDIVRLVGSDPALSARVIKAANVLLTNPSRPITTIADAVTVLGVHALRQLVLGIALIADYRSGPCKQFNYPYFWAHSLLTGIAAKHLAARARLAVAEEIFVLGLLGNIGQLALATAYPEEYGDVLECAKGKALAELYRQERDKFDCDHAELSEAILADMHFPRIFQVLARDFRQPESSKATEGSREWRLTHLLHVASLLADACLAGPAERGALVAKLRLHAARVAIETDHLIEIGDACVRDWLDWLELMHMGMVHIPPFAELLSQSDAADAAAEVPHWAHADQADYKMRVLVVEDDRAMLVLLEAMLKTAGHEVLVARNGVEAMRIVEQQHPQLVITGWTMQQMDGITLCRRLRESQERRDVYVIILTIQESVDRLVEAFDAGADDYLVKPIAQKVFFARLRAAQRVVRLQEELAFDREQLLRFSKDLAASNERLQRLALTDALTELPNRRFAMERIEQEWALSKRGDRTLSCMMVDVDYFKAINDKFGHQAGDEALKCIANTLRQSARTQDVVCRYGGEEFLVICPDTGIDAAYQCAERLRLNVAALKFRSQGADIKLTISVGVAQKKGGIASVEDLLSRADECLYAAKQGGRNRAVCAK
ncbi:diguanylate cyclase [Candidatus Ferrigenium straubiae]|jgi:diguanylate cyclase (GGDEF)-like protein|uniref:diguanylate cyclase n=1 Tax=Candidatus Ferrigenium straubiae TaxID=2919506 RepID=UPI003F4A9F42